MLRLCRIKHSVINDKLREDDYEKNNSKWLLVAPLFLSSFAVLTSCVEPSNGPEEQIKTADDDRTITFNDQFGKRIGQAVIENNSPVPLATVIDMTNTVVATLDPAEQFKQWSISPTDTNWTRDATISPIIEIKTNKVIFLAADGSSIWDEFDVPYGADSPLPTSSPMSGPNMMSSWSGNWTNVTSPQYIYIYIYIYSQFIQLLIISLEMVFSIMLELKAWLFIVFLPERKL